MNRLWVRTAIAVLLTAGVCLAQTPETPKFYKLDFVIREMEGSRVINARAYSSSASGGGGCSMRTGSKVPIATSSGYNFFDVGVNIDCSSLSEAGGELSMRIVGDISSLVEMTPPVVRQNRWNSVVLVPLKKPTVVFSSDDLTTKRQMQLEVTATPIK